MLPAMTIRPARPDDKTVIAAFTTDTFSWGDYVADAFDSWMDDPNGQILIAANDADEAIGMARVSLLSSTEAWAQAARVHPDNRRQGIGGRLTEAGEIWAAGQGALVMRLITEDWNEPAQRQVEKSGYRMVAHWAMAEKSSVVPFRPFPATAAGEHRPRNGCDRPRSMRLNRPFSLGRPET